MNASHSRVRSTDERFDLPLASQTINGKSCPSPTSFVVVDPATGLPFAQSPDATRQQLNDAVEAARQAQKSWARRTLDERRALLRQFAAALRQASAALAPLLTREQGKPLYRSEDEIKRAAAAMEALCELELKPELLKHDAVERVELHYRPLGVIGAITPWNVPIFLACTKIAQALLSGNTVVLKPSPYTPLATLEMGRLGIGILPPGVLNVLAGGNDLGQWMTEHPDIAKISFTGSVPTGKRVMQSAAGTLKRLTLELGGNDAAIVLPDARVKDIAEKIFWAAFYNSGQTCMAIKRLYVHDSLHDALCQELVALAKQVKVGSGLDPDVKIGPVQNRMQFDQVRAVIEETLALPGVSLLSGGLPPASGGYFVEPTLFSSIQEGCRLVDEETFGPVLPVLRFHDVEDAVARANAFRVGLGASVWTRDLALGERIAHQLEAGTVWVNAHVNTDMAVPFGGAKESGLGREFGLLGLKGYTEPAVVCVRE